MTDLLCVLAGVFIGASAEIYRLLAIRRRIAWVRPRDTRNRVVGYRPVAWPALRATRICQICYGHSTKPCPKCVKRGHSLDRPKRNPPAKCPQCWISTGCPCAQVNALIQARRIARLTGRA